MTGESTDSSAHGAEPTPAEDGDGWSGQPRVVLGVIALVVGSFVAVRLVLGVEPFRQLLAIALFFGLDLIWRRLIITEGGYLVADLALFAVLESGFLLAHRVIDGPHPISSSEVFKVTAALAVYLVLLFILTQLKQENIARMGEGFADLVNELSHYHEKELVKYSEDRRRELIERHETQRRAIELVRQMAEDTVWVNVFSKDLRGPRRKRAKRVVALLKRLCGDEFLKQKEVPLDLATFYVPRNPWWSIGAGLCTLFVLVAAIFPV
jgi:hypothetical protein